MREQSRTGDETSERELRESAELFGSMRETPGIVHRGRKARVSRRQSRWGGRGFA